MRCAGAILRLDWCIYTLAYVFTPSFVCQYLDWCVFTLDWCVYTSLERLHVPGLSSPSVRLYATSLMRVQLYWWVFTLRLCVYTNPLLYVLISLGLPLPSFRASPCFFVI